MNSPDPHTARTVIHEPTNGDLFPDDDTPVSLVDGLKAGEDDAWSRFVRIFSPMIYGMLRNRRLPEDDAFEIGQQVLQKVHRSMGNFEWDGEKKRVRYWLPSIIRTVIADAWKARAKQPRAIGGSEFAAATEQVPDSSADLWKQLEDDSFEPEPSDFQVAYAEGLKSLKTRFQPRVWQCFYERHSSNLPEKDIAETLGMTEVAVRQAVFRVRKAFEKQFEGLMD